MSIILTFVLTVYGALAADPTVPQAFPRQYDRCLLAVLIGEGDDVGVAPITINHDIDEFGGQPLQLEPARQRADLADPSAQKALVPIDSAFSTVYVTEGQVFGQLATDRSGTGPLIAGQQIFQLPSDGAVSRLYVLDAGPQCEQH